VIASVRMDLWNRAFLELEVEIEIWCSSDIAGSASKNGRYDIHPRGTPRCLICGLPNTKFGQVSSLGMVVPLGCTWGAIFFRAWGIHPPYMCAKYHWSTPYGLGDILSHKLVTLFIGENALKMDPQGILMQILGLCEQLFFEYVHGQTNTVSCWV